MHTEFSDLYREISPEASRETLTLRWQAVVALVQEMGSVLGKVCELIRIFWRTVGLNEEDKRRFTKPFLDKDPTFPGKSNEFELQVLAGAAVLEILSNPAAGSIRPLVALAVVAGQFGREEIHPFQLRCVRLCRDYLNNLSVEIRDIHNTGAPQKWSEQPGYPAFEKVVIALQTAGDQPVVGGNAVILARSLKGELERLQAGLAETAQLFLDRHEVLAEETNILWWVEGAYSERQECPFADVGPCGSLIAAFELDGLTRFAPGPRSSHAFLRRVLRGGGATVCLPEQCINDAPMPWRHQITKLSENGIQDICPLLYAIAQSTLDCEPSGWVSRVERRHQISLSKPLHEHIIAQQFFLELQVMKLGSEKRTK